MLTQAQIKLIRSLSDKKARKENALFIVEGVKGVSELLNSSLELRALYCVKEWEKEVPLKHQKRTQVITDELLNRISHLTHPNKVLALVDIPNNGKLNPEVINENTLLLDGINDPGNLGTIIRLAHWFGIKKIICSKNTVDVYNPKVIQATMGSFAYVNVFYEELEEFISGLKMPVYCADMQGENIFETKIKHPFALIMGSESHGVSKELAAKCKALTIPSFEKTNKPPDSLNVAIAASIILSQVIGAGK